MRRNGRFSLGVASEAAISKNLRINHFPAIHTFPYPGRIIPTYRFTFHKRLDHPSTTSETLSSHAALLHDLATVNEGIAIRC